MNPSDDKHCSSVQDGLHSKDLDTDRMAAALAGQSEAARCTPAV